MKRISVALPEQQIVALQKQAAQTGLKFAEVLRRAIDEYLEQRQSRQSMLVPRHKSP